MAALHEEDSLLNCRTFTCLGLAPRKDSIHLVTRELNEYQTHEHTYPIKQNKDGDLINEDSKLERDSTS